MSQSAQSPIAGLLKQALASYPDVRVLALDPGETTGACVFEGPNLLDARQLHTGLMPMAAVEVRRYINNWHTPVSNDPDVTPFTVDFVVMEDYRVYSWKSDEHKWAGLHTPRLIGGIELICYDLQLNLSKQTAQMAKGFCTDNKLEAWGLYQEGMRHARDAIRHAVYHLLFKVAKIQGKGKAPFES